MAMKPNTVLIRNIRAFELALSLENGFEIIDIEDETKYKEFYNEEIT